MKNLLFLLLFTGFAAGCSEKPAGNQLAPEAYAAQMQKEAGVLLDVRTVEEYSEGHLEGAAQLDYYETESFESALDTMDKSKTYYIYCRSGGRSGTVLTMMQQKGFKSVYNLDGGILAWRKADMPVVMP